VTITVYDLRKLIIAPLLLIVGACTGLPEGIQPINSLDTDRYLGTWYEIARLDHSFEQGLSRVTAKYESQEDGSLKVINRGYNDEKNEWKEAEGRAVFVNEDTDGHLKVSFFGPFYASYVIFELDDQYQRAYITGYNRNYLWFLSRSPTVSDEAMAEFRETALDAGFELQELIVVDHSTIN
jgi:apolipoprotein D and lipocalin family protein